MNLIFDSFTPRSAREANFLTTFKRSLGERQKKCLKCFIPSLATWLHQSVPCISWQFSGQGQMSLVPFGGSWSDSSLACWGFFMACFILVRRKKSIGQRLNHPCRFGLEFGYTKPPCGDFESPQPPEWWFKVLLTLINILTHLYWDIWFSWFSWIILRWVSSRSWTRSITSILASYSGASLA